MKKVFALQWHITERCDQRCSHCYIFNDPKYIVSPEIDLNGLKLIADKLINFCDRNNYEPYVALTGGDPLLYPDIWGLLEYLNKKNIKWRIMGNPFNLNKGVVKKIKDLGCQRYQMSLDGLRETHDSIRKPGSFDETIEKIELLNEIGIASQIMTTVSRLNFNEIPDLIRLLVEKKLKFFAFARYVPVVSDVDLSINPMEYKKFLERVWDVYGELSGGETTFILKDQLWKPFLFEKGLLKTVPTQSVLDGCHIGSGNLSVLTDGTVYACRRFESPLGNVLNCEFDEMYFGDVLDSYKNVENIDGCKDCELLYFCRGCRAVACGTTGSCLDKDPQCWRQ